MIEILNGEVTAWVLAEVEGGIVSLDMFADEKPLVEELTRKVHLVV
jgi:hypothetical protein